MKKLISIAALLIVLCLLCTSCCCFAMRPDSPGHIITPNRTVCGICGGTGVQQTQIGIDPTTGMPLYSTIGCGGCGGSGYIG